MRRLLALLLVVAAAACSDSDPFASLPEPDEVERESTTTTMEPDFTTVPLAAVEGSTTTVVAFGPGPVTIVGRVEGPDGVIPDAIVQLERVIGDTVVTTRVPTAPDGTWNLANVLGGRYRIRAWRTPDLATPRAELVFLESGPQRVVSLRVEPVGGVRVDNAIAPDPPIIFEEANLLVRVAERSVDAEGVTRDTPLASVAVRLVGSGDWRVQGSNTSFTGADGSVTFRVTCEEEGEQPLLAELENGQRYALVIPPCVDPDATTTTTEATTTTTEQ